MRRFTLAVALLTSLVVACSDTETKIVEQIPARSAAYPSGACDTGETCFQGACVATSGLCSEANESGTCPTGFACYGGGCILAASVPTTPAACSPTAPNGSCNAGQSCFMGSCLATADICSASNQEGACPAGWSCYGGGCVLDAFVPPVEPEPVDACATASATATQPVLKFASDFITTNDGQPFNGAAAYTYDDDNNAATPPVAVPYTKKGAITVDGKQYRDLNANGTLDKYEDWRYSPLCRAKDLVTRMTPNEKIGLMGETMSIGDGSATVLAQGTINTLFIENRRQALIRPADITPTQYAAYLNNVQALSEGAKHGIPFAVTADPIHFVTQSTNATSGAVSLSINPAVTQWPNPMGLGAINDAAVSFQYGDTVRKDFVGSGFRWQLGPMADLATEPRWARFITTFGENAYAVSKHTKEVILGFQAGKSGGLTEGIAATMKHFPGSGPQEDGRDSHGPRGKYTIYPGENFEYHLLSFQAAIDAGAAAVMPLYAITQGVYEWNPLQTGTVFSEGLVTRLLKEKLGFDGMVTSDWGTFGNSAFGVEVLSQAERAALFVKAGSHQLGNDSIAHVQAAFDQGLLTEAEIDGAAMKILEMSFKLGIFENPYTDPAMSAKARTGESMQAGFDAQKKAIVLLRNAGNAARLPINNWRYTNATGGTPNAPDANEFTSDADKDGKVEVFFDGVVDALNGTDRYSTAPINLLQPYDYSAAGEGTPGTLGYTIPIVAAADAAGADVAVLRITARKGQYSGIDAGVPLSFDAPYPGRDTDGGRTAAVKDAQKVIDLFRVRDGYTNAAGTFVPPTNTNLKIVVVMYMDRPGIVKPFINGLKTLDERPGCNYTGTQAEKELCYPVVSDDAGTVNQTIVTTAWTTANPSAPHPGVDSFLVEFGAYDRAVLDFIFNKNVPTTPAGYVYGQARLPVEIPSTDAYVEAQYEDLPNDSYVPTFIAGFGSNLPQN
jgi:beta-glucosidase